jgi:drug/metabolite transporter (DMT)-like permease
VFLLAPLLLGERPRIAEGMTLIIAMAGVAVIFFGQGGTDGPALMVALLAGLGYGVLTVILRALRLVEPAIVVTINCLGSALLLLPAVPIWGSFAVPPGAILWLMLLSLLGFAAPYALFSIALRHVEAYRASLLLLIETVLNALFTWLVVGEAVPPATLAGGPLILLGVGLWIATTWHRERRERLRGRESAIPGVAHNG